MRTMTALIAIAAVAAAVPALAPAQGGSSDVLRSGKCTNGATWKLKAKHDDGRLEVEFEVDQNRNGRRWNVALRRNGAVAFRGVRVTRPPSGSFSVERRLADGAGADRIVATASTNGGRCRGALTV